MCHKKIYNDYSSYIRRRFGQRVQKIAINAGFSCPNRDGRLGILGCVYCNNQTFNPFYCSPEKSIRQQLNQGIAFFAKKYKTQKYLAYFQAYSNTYAPLNVLRTRYQEALSHPLVVGLVIATRPDCVDSEKLAFLEQLAQNYYVAIEYGIESCYDETLQRIERKHTYKESVWAIEATAGRGIHTVGHLILGLPGESRQQMLQQADMLSELPLNGLKLHQLQIIKGTELARQYLAEPQRFKLFEVDDYVSLCAAFVRRLRQDIIIERFTSESPPGLLIAPRWQGLKNYELVHKIEKYLAEAQKGE